MEISLVIPCLQKAELLGTVGLPRKKLSQAWYFLRNNVSRVSLILKIFVTYSANDTFQYPMKTSRNILIFSFRKFSVLMMILRGIKKIDWKLIGNFM